MPDTPTTRPVSPIASSMAIWVEDIQLKFAVNNLFNEDYLSVLSRPMPGINFEFFIGITPKFGKNKKKSENTNM